MSLNEEAAKAVFLLGVIPWLIPAACIVVHSHTQWLIALRRGEVQPVALTCAVVIVVRLAITQMLVHTMRVVAAAVN